MELEKQRKPTTPPSNVTPLPTEATKTYQAQPTKTFVPIQKNYSQEVCVIMGVLLLITGLVGFVVDNLLGAHLSYTHNAIHVALGALALWFGFDSLANAKRFSYFFGTIYGLLGIVGFALGREGLPDVGNIVEDRYLWKAIPKVLEFGTVDHVLHLIFAAVFILGAVMTFKRFQRI
nr:hypothetical protein [uncultured Bdellovibrio sp.]